MHRAMDRRRFLSTGLTTSLAAGATGAIWPASASSRHDEVDYTALDAALARSVLDRARFAEPVIIERTPLRFMRNATPEAVTECTKPFGHNPYGSIPHLP
ncbi:MAG: hypothetical protein AAF730_15605 [Bacteroidota bacterium]